jgi:hypothetical protein
MAAERPRAQIARTPCSPVALRAVGGRTRLDIAGGGKQDVLAISRAHKLDAQGSTLRFPRRHRESRKADRRKCPLGQLRLEDPGKGCLRADVELLVERQLAGDRAEHDREIAQKEFPLADESRSRLECLHKRPEPDLAGVLGHPGEYELRIRLAFARHHISCPELSFGHPEAGIDGRRGPHRRAVHLFDRPARVPEAVGPVKQSRTNILGYLHAIRVQNKRGTLGEIVPARRHGNVPGVSDVWRGHGRESDVEIGNTPCDRARNSHELRADEAVWPAGIVGRDPARRRTQSMQAAGIGRIPDRPRNIRAVPDGADARGHRRSGSARRAPGVISLFRGFSVWPCKSFLVNQRSENAGVLVRPRMIPPAFRIFETTGLSSAATSAS